MELGTGALAYIFMEQDIDKCVVGIANSNQLRELIATIGIIKRKRKLEKLFMCRRKANKSITMGGKE